MTHKLPFTTGKDGETVGPALVTQADIDRALAAEPRIMGKTAQERREINAIPLWVALRWFIMSFWHRLDFDKSDKYIRDKDRRP